MSIPGSPPASAATVASAVLQAVIDYYAAHADDPDRPAEALPAARYVAPGAPREVPWDNADGQLTVAMQGFVAGLDAMSPPRPMPMRKADPAQLEANLQVTLVTQLVRCQPSLTRAGRPLGSSTLEGQALALIADGQHLSTALINGALNGAFVRESVYGQVLVGDAAPVGPMGELAAVEVAVTIPLL